MDNVLSAVLVLGIMGGVFGAVLAVAARIFHVDQDEHITLVREALPGANCGGCGYPGCDGYAAAVAAGEAPPDKCVVGGLPVAAKVAEIMGIDAGAQEKMVAFVHCSGEEGVAKKFFDYTGPQDCVAAMRFGNQGPKACQFSCIGLGNCARACQFDAMHVENGAAVVDREKCVGCQACVAACPKDIIKMVPYNQKVLVGCRSKDKGAQTRKVCDVGCIACMRCQKECPVGAIVVKDNLAQIDYDKCIGRRSMFRLAENRGEVKREKSGASAPDFFSFMALGRLQSSRTRPLERMTSPADNAGRAHRR